ncbi:hypothetical protein DFJ77DRAFT_507846 [Powellomyces hirtus]|nr:hypothetical protein DFJ77DRAFT_507846 [Powellomyces hirtus]
MSAHVDALALQLSRSINLNAKPLYVDALNYADMFFDPKALHWEWLDAITRISHFVTFARNANYRLVVFIDAAIQSPEAILKWRSRRAREVRTQTRTMPLGVSSLIGDAFRKCGVRVLYSLDADNDDTLAAYAHHDRAALLSRDQDMFRYIGSTFTVYDDFDMNYTTQTLRLHRATQRHVRHPRPIPDLASLPATLERDFQLCEMRNGKYIRGAPSALVKKLGNLHIPVRPLRQALYKRLGQDHVLETFPTWSTPDDQVVWDETLVAADDAWDADLDRPREAVEKLFPAASLIKPDDVTGREWENHCYALHAVVFEICVLANNINIPTTSAPDDSPQPWTLFSLLLPVSQEKLGTTLDEREQKHQTKCPGSRQRVDITCRTCATPFRVAGGELEFYVEKGYSLPKQCKQCRAAKKKRSAHR